jgi:hypothetical protein
MTWKATWVKLIGAKSISDHKDNMDKMDKTPSTPNSVHSVHSVLQGEKSNSDEPEAETTTSYRAGPPYPDGLGRVKCFYCIHCEITGTKAVCRVSGEPVTGIALLIECFDFTMKAAL